METERNKVVCQQVTATASPCEGVKSMLPFISVIIPIYNEEDFISDTLEQISRQDYPRDRYEILVIDGKSSDWTREIVHAKADLFTHFKILDNPKKVSSAARNIGFRNARGDYIIIIDGHVYIENNRLFHDMVEIFEETGLEVLSRPQPLTPPDNSYFQNAVAYARESLIGHGMDSTIYNIEYTGPVNPSSSGAMYRRSVVNTVGYFDEDFDAAEDYEYNYRIASNNKKSYISPRLAIYYYPRNKLSGLFQQMRRYGLGRNRMLRKHRAGLRSGTLIPPLFFFTLLALTALSFVIKNLWICPALMAGVYLAALIFVSLNISLRRGLRYFPALPLIYLTIHFGLAYGMVSGFFLGNSRPKNQHKS